MEHVPVLLDECMKGLAIKSGGTYLDGTLGRGGHALEIAKRLRTGKLICVDKDQDAIAEAEEQLREYGQRVTIVRGNFEDIGAILDRLDIKGVDGMLFDLGVSSPQLDDAGRGFSYSREAPLDMRMDKSSPLTAYEVVNTYTRDELKNILYKYGEERYAPRIAGAIARRRGRQPIGTTVELVEVIRSAMPPKALREKQHPAKRSFQGLRVFVNDELGALEKMLAVAPERLNQGGRLCVISFHSLEDRLVKDAFQSRTSGCTCPKDFPVCACGFAPTLRVITKKPITPDEKEMERNPRSRSAKLRIAERI